MNKPTKSRELYSLVLPAGSEDNIGKVEDCVIRAFSLAFDIPYPTVVQHFYYICHPNNGGYSFNDIRKVVDTLDYDYRVLVPTTKVLVREMLENKSTMIVGCTSQDEYHVTLIKKHKLLDSSAKFLDYEVIFCFSF